MSKKLEVRDLSYSYSILNLEWKEQVFPRTAASSQKPGGSSQGA